MFFSLQDSQVGEKKEGMSLDRSFSPSSRDIFSAISSVEWSVRVAVLARGTPQIEGGFV